MRFEILEIFPFESSKKRMGIILRNEETKTIEYLFIIIINPKVLFERRRRCYNQIPKKRI